MHNIMDALQRMSEKEARRELMESLRTRHKRWLGHLLHHGFLVRTVLEGRLPGKNGRERPKEMLLCFTCYQHTQAHQEGE